MALDITVDNYRGLENQLLRLFLDDYDIIMTILEDQDELPILKKSLVNYYGDSEVYLIELNALKQEVIQVETFEIPKPTVEFLKEFIELIETAERARCTIKFSGD